MKTNTTKRAKYSDFLQDWNEMQTNAVKIAVRDFLKSAPAWDTFSGGGYCRRSFGLCNFYELERRVGLAYTSSGACAGLWVCNLSIYAPNDWHPTKAAGRYKAVGFVMAADCSIWAAIEEENETDFYFLQISEPTPSAPSFLIREEKYTREDFAAAREKNELNIIKKHIFNEWRAHKEAEGVQFLNEHPSGLRAGDFVIFRNDSGVTFEPFEVLAFDPAELDRCVYLNWASYWFCAKLTNLTKIIIK